MGSTECPPGYHGFKCTFKCPIPTFGEGCGGKCSETCLSDCHHIYGCLQKATKLIQTTNSGNLYSMILIIDVYSK